MGGTLEAPWEGGSGSGNWKLTGRLEPLDSFIDSFKEMTILRLGSGGVLWRLLGRAALDRFREQKKLTVSSESAIQAVGRPMQGMV